MWSDTTYLILHSMSSKALSGSSFLMNVYYEASTLPGAMTSKSGHAIFDRERGGTDAKSSDNQRSWPRYIFPIIIVSIEAGKPQRA